MTNMFKPSKTAKSEIQKTKALFGGILVSFLMVAYQNCSSQTSHTSGYVDKATEQKPALLELRDSSSLTLIDTLEIREFGPYAYEIDVNTGVAQRTMYDVPKEDPVNAPQKFCLSQEKLAALVSAYNSTSVCLYKTKSENMACTMDYIYPYAIVTQATNSSARNTYKLGENAKPCNDYYDLCTENRDAFVLAARNALVGLSESLCE